MKNISNSKFNLNTLPKGKRNENLYSFSSFNDLFYYHNQRIFSFIPTDSNNIIKFYLIIKSNISNSYFRCILSKTYVNKVMRYYDDINDKFLFIYQFYYQIKYFTVEK